MNASLRFLSLISLFVACVTNAMAQSTEIKNSTVKIIASGVVDPLRGLPGQGGKKNTSFGTGVVVSDDGFILTTNHLLENLGPVIGETVQILARVAGNGQDLTAFVVDARPMSDLLLLKLQLPGPYSFMRLGTAYDVGNDTISTYGFPQGGQADVTGESKVTSRTVEGGYLWGTSFNFVEGQSGSPVYNVKGEVVAIAKGMVNGSGAIIPIDYADSVLSFLRFRRLAAVKLTDIIQADFNTGTEQSVDLPIRSSEGLCFLVGVHGRFDHPADSAWIEITADGKYQLRGRGDGAAGHGASARCLKY
jgi:S1-C subfamily serine protease